MKAKAPAPRLVGKLSLETPLGNFLADKRIRLLEAIDTYGSLNRAAKAVPLSYKAAWDALDAMNNLAEAPLVTSSTGGQHGGGSHLTDYGRQMVILYRAMETVYQDALDQLPQRLSQHLPDTASHDKEAVRTFIKRLAIKTSARNQFVGTVTTIEDMGGMVNVHLRLDGPLEIAASLTRESVETMALVPGAEVFALTKAPWVTVTNKPQRRSSKRNVLSGVITRIAAAASSTELVITTTGGQIVTAVMNNTKVKELGLARSMKTKAPVWVVFATASVILATYS